MRYNKIAFIISLTSTIIAFTCFGLFGYVEKYQNLFIKDIALALIGSGVFLIVTSIIGYFVEKKNMQILIMKSFCELGIGCELLIEGDNAENGQKKLNAKALSRLINSTKNKVSAFYLNCRMYYDGSFKKNEKMKILLNENLRNYNYSLSMFEYYLSSEHPENNVLTKKFFEILQEDEELTNCIDKCLRELKFRFGESFNISDTFVREYEEEE